MDTRLLDILVCPLCKGPLEYARDAQELRCNGDHLAYPIRDGIPIMWADEARDMNAAVGVKPTVVSSLNPPDNLNNPPNNPVHD
ncbi:MAG: Trm112 family protein [Herbaspirillum sp.]